MSSPSQKNLTEPSWNLNGRAMLDFLKGDREAHVVVHSMDEEPRVIEARDYFKELEEFGPLDVMALDLCRGRVLDIGAGAGRFALELERLGIEVRAIDTSDEAVKVMRKRGLNDVECADLVSTSPGRFDTLLLMMNGIGIVGDLEGLRRFLRVARERLRPGGQILFDSLDLEVYRGQGGAEGAARVAWQSEADPGVVRFTIAYKDEIGKPFDWFFVDPVELGEVAKGEGWRSQIVYEEEDGAFLARLTRSVQPVAGAHSSS